MLIPLDRSILRRALELRSKYVPGVVAENPILSPVVREFVNLSIQLSGGFGRYVHHTTSGDAVTRSSVQLAGDFRYLVSLRDHLRTVPTAGTIVTLLNASIKRIAFRFSKAAAGEASIADLYDVAGWSEHV